NDLDPRFVLRNRRGNSHKKILDGRAFGRTRRVASDRYFTTFFTFGFEHNFEVRGRGLQFELYVRHTRSEKVKRNQREDGDTETAGGGNERFRNTAGDSLNGQLFVAQESERSDQSRNRSQQTEQRRECDQCVHHGQEPARAFDFDTGRNLQGALQRRVLMV